MANDFVVTDKIPMSEVFDDSDIETFEFPKYTTQVMNLANQNAWWTRPAVVWQLSELIHEIPENTVAWRKNWYLKHMWDKIDIATNKVWEMVQSMKMAYSLINKEMVRNWVYDLIINKTAYWLMFQEYILQFLGKKYKLQSRSATPEEESKNIDWYIWKIPVQIKSDTYKSKKSSVQEKIEVPIIYYKETDKFLSIDDSEFSAML